MARAIKSAKRADDRRRPGVGDNAPFTARPTSSGLGVGQRLSNVVSPTMPLHQYTNRSAEKKGPNGKSAPKKKPTTPKKV